MTDDYDRDYEMRRIEDAEHLLRQKIERLVEKEVAGRVAAHAARMAKLEAVYEAASMLMKSGYDGPWIGEVCVPLYAAVNALENTHLGVLRMTPHELTNEAFERAAWVCESMMVGGRAWTEEQRIAAQTLGAAAKAIRSLKTKEI